MASIFQRFWQWLTGNKPSSGPDPAPSKPITFTTVDTGSSDDSDPTPPSSGSNEIVHALSRGESNDSGMTGKLLEASTIEDASNHLTPGTYPLTLNKDIALNSAYSFRFPDHHKGMIQIEDPNDNKKKFVRLGASGDESRGGIAIPDIGQYLNLYVTLTEDLEAGKSISISV